MPRNPTSTAEHIAKGTFRPNRHADRADVAYPHGAPPEPEHLGEVGRELWRDIVTQTPPEALCEIDWPGLTECCRWYELSDTYHRLLLDDPLEYKVLKACTDASNKFLQYMSKFGLSPVDRARIKISRTAKSAENPMTAILQLKAAT